FTFAHGKGQFVDFTFCELPKNILAGDYVIEEVLTGFQGAFGVPPGINLKCNSTVNHAIFLQNSRRTAAGRAVRNCNEHALTSKSLIWLLNAVPQVRRRPGYG